MKGLREAAWLLQTTVGGGRVTNWLAQTDLIGVVMMDDFYRGQSMLIDWLHVLHLYIECIPIDGRLEFFSKANDEHV